MARNHKFFFDSDGSPKARGPASEKVLMAFLEQDVQGSDHICRDLMDDLTAIEDQSDDSREFIGNAHRVNITPEGVVIDRNLADDAHAAVESAASTVTRDVLAESPATADSVTTAEQETGESTEYRVALKHFREVLEDWEAFILDDQLDDPLADDEYL